MFKKIALISAVTILVLSSSVHAAPVGEYFRAGYVEDVDPEAVNTVLVDCKRHVWHWGDIFYDAPEGRELIPVGSRVIIKIDGRGTKRISDDIIINFEVFE